MRLRPVFLRMYRNQPLAFWVDSDTILWVTAQNLIRCLAASHNLTKSEIFNNQTKNKRSYEVPFAAFEPIAADQEKHLILNEYGIALMVEEIAPDPGAFLAWLYETLKKYRKTSCTTEGIMLDSFHSRHRFADVVKMKYIDIPWQGEIT